MRGGLLSSRGFAVLAPALAGAFAALGQVPWSLLPLSLAGFCLLVWLVARGEGRWRSALTGWIAGSLYFGIALNWITEPFQVDAERDGWMAPFALVFMAVGLALFWGLAGALAGGVRCRRRRALAFALALAAVEALRATVLTGFPWALPGHIWLGFAPEQLAAILGAGGLTLLTLALATLPVAFGLRGLGASAVVLATVWGFGVWRAGGALPPDRDVMIRLVQPNADQALKWDPDHARDFFERHLDLTAAPAPGPAPDLIVWPETAVPFLLNNPGMALDAMLAASAGVPVAVGIQRTEGLRGYNSLALIAPDEAGLPDILATYDKHHLVPFGEYIPLGDQLADWLGVFSFSPAEGNGYSAGPGPALITAPGLPTFQPLICYEAVFPYFQRAVARPEWLLQITNDAWFGDASGPFQHAAINRLRAIESGLPLVRVANTGVSMVVDARGGVRESLPLNEAGFLDAALPGALEPTPYARFGRWPGVVLWAFAALLFFRRKSVTD